VRVNVTTPPPLTFPCFKPISIGRYLSDFSQSYSPRSEQMNRKKRWRLGTERMVYWKK